MEKKKKVFDRDISIVLCGQAGQGIQTIEKALSAIVHEAGYHVFSMNEFMSRVRGGVNSTQIRISHERTQAFVRRTDLCIPLTGQGIDHLGERIQDDTLIIADSSKVDVKRSFVDVPLFDIASKREERFW